MELLHQAEPRNGSVTVKSNFPRVVFCQTFVVLCSFALQIVKSKTTCRSDLPCDYLCFLRRKALHMERKRKWGWLDVDQNAPLLPSKKKKKCTIAGAAAGELNPKGEFLPDLLCLDSVWKLWNCRNHSVWNKLMAMRPDEVGGRGNTGSGRLRSGFV